jgi:hypothetical protein
MIDFPSSPITGATYTYLGRTWTYDGVGWERLINAGQIVSVFIMPGLEVQVYAAAIPYTIVPDWHLINYV